MADISTEELIAVWDIPRTSTREIDFYKTSTTNWIDILLTRVFNEEFFTIFFSEGEQEIPVTFEMLSFQDQRGKKHWYTFSREILAMQDSFGGSRVSRCTIDVLKKIKFIRLLKINENIPQISNKKTIEYRIQYLKDFRKILKSAITIDVEEHFLVFEALASELESLSEKYLRIEEENRKKQVDTKQLEKIEKQMEEENKSATETIKGESSSEIEEKKNAGLAKIEWTKNRLISTADNTASKIIEKNESVVKSQPITILNKNSSSILLMNSQGLLRLIKNNRPFYYSKCDTSLRFYKWYSSTRCELVCNGKSTSLQSIKFNSNESAFSGEESAIISRVFLLEKIKLVRSSLKEALDDHHGN